MDILWRAEIQGLSKQIIVIAKNISLLQVEDGKLVERVRAELVPTSSVGNVHYEGCEIRVLFLSTLHGSFAQKPGSFWPQESSSALSD